MFTPYVTLLTLTFKDFIYSPMKNRLKVITTYFSLDSKLNGNYSEFNVLSIVHKFMLVF